jgi:hypothetical protein
MITGEERDQIVAALVGTEDEQEFWRKHLTEYVGQYPDQFIAVRDGAVVAAHWDLRQLERDLTERGIEPTEVWIRFLASTPGVALL